MVHDVDDSWVVELCVVVDVTDYWVRVFGHLCWLLADEYLPQNALDVRLDLLSQQALDVLDEGRTHHDLRGSQLSFGTQVGVYVELVLLLLDAV